MSVSFGRLFMASNMPLKTRITHSTSFFFNSNLQSVMPTPVRITPPKVDRELFSLSMSMTDLSTSHAVPTLTTFLIQWTRHFQRPEDLHVAMSVSASPGVVTLMKSTWIRLITSPSLFENLGFLMQFLFLFQLTLTVILVLSPLMNPPLLPVFLIRPLLAASNLHVLAPDETSPMQ